MTAPRVTVIDSLETVAHDWSRFVKDGPPQLSTRWLRTYHNSFGRPSRYAVVRADDGRLLAVCVFHVREHDDHHRKYDIADLITRADMPKPMARRLERVARRPALVVVAPGSYTAGWYVPESGQLQGAVTRALVGELRQVAAEAGARSLFFPHNEKGRAAALAAEIPSSVMLIGDQVASLDLSGVDDFAGYLARLPPGRRRKIRRDRRRFAEAGLSIRVQTNFHDLESMVGRQCSHYKRHNIVADPGRVQRQLESLHRWYDRDMTIIEVVRGEVTIGHVVVVTEGDWIVPRLAGFEADVPFAYFEAGYYRVVEMALGTLGRTLVDYGGTSADAKRWRGCNLADTVDVVGLTE